MCWCCLHSWVGLTENKMHINRNDDGFISWPQGRWLICPRSLCHSEKLLNTLPGGTLWKTEERGTKKAKWTYVGLCQRKRICLNPTREFPVQPFIAKVFVEYATTLGSPLGSSWERQWRILMLSLWVSEGSSFLCLRLAEDEILALPSDGTGRLWPRKHAVTEFFADFRVSFAPKKNWR